MRAPMPETVFDDMEAAREDAQWQADQYRGASTHRSSYTIVKYGDIFRVLQLNSARVKNHEILEVIRPGAVRYDLQTVL